MKELAGMNLEKDRGGMPDDEDERDDSPYCDCGAIPTQEEEDFNRCGCCGKLIDP